MTHKSLLEAAAFPERLGLSVRSAVLAASGAQVNADRDFSLYGFATVSSTMDISAAFAHGELPLGELQTFCLVDSSMATQPNEAPRRKVLAFLALAQTQGRGRKQRSWLSAEGQGIYITFLVETEREAAQLSGLSLVAGLAIQEFAGKLGAKTLLKWPNDVLGTAAGSAEKRKLAGVLVDVHSSLKPNLRTVHVGVGVNLSTQEFPAGIPGISLESLSGNLPHYAQAVATLISTIGGYLKVFFEKGFDEFAEIWNSRSGTIGETTTVDLPQGQKTGIVVGVMADGALRLKDGTTGEESLIYSGELR